MLLEHLFFCASMAVFLSKKLSLQTIHAIDGMKLLILLLIFVLSGLPSSLCAEEVIVDSLYWQNAEQKMEAYGNTVFREGDKVMQIKNNYQIEWEIVGRYNIPIDKGMGVFNGDMGRVKEINDTMSTLLVEFDDGRRVNYPFSALEELELSYAITIHKSQGSEYPAVILPLLGGPRMLFNRNLLYTGITRARNCVTILGSSETVRNMIENVSENRRYTGLEQRIREICCLPENDTP